MIGYVLLNTEGVLSRREQSYIEEVNPQFFSENKHLMIKAWKFNTDDRDCMIRMLRDFKDFGVPSPMIMLFLNNIQFNLEQLKANNANSL